MKTDNRPLRNRAAAYCLTCERHTEQSRGQNRGERHCWGCGSNFTLEESRAALQDEECEGCGASADTLRLTDDEVALCQPCFAACPCVPATTPPSTLAKAAAEEIQDWNECGETQGSHDADVAFIQAIIERCLAGGSEGVKPD